MEMMLRPGRYPSIPEPVRERLNRPGYTPNLLSELEGAYQAVKKFDEFSAGLVRSLGETAGMDRLQQAEAVSKARKRLEELRRSVR
jgi:hypothetical protein